MPYQKNADLPDSVKDNIPTHAQDIYREAYNSAWDHYKNAEDRQKGKDREETAHSVAWAAVKKKYEKKNDKWVEKDD